MGSVFTVFSFGAGADLLAEHSILEGQTLQEGRICTEEDEGQKYRHAMKNSMQLKKKQSQLADPRKG